jgi:hypothetical protein
MGNRKDFFRARKTPETHSPGRDGKYLVKVPESAEDREFGVHGGENTNWLIVRDFPYAIINVSSCTPQGIHSMNPPKRKKVLTSSRCRPVESQGHLAVVFKYRSQSCD